MGVKPGPSLVSSFLPPEFQGPPSNEKEALLRRLVALLEKEAEVINQKVTDGPVRHTLERTVVG